ncbi:MAG: hypothetical protein ACTS3F_00030 [Phycisphaerales bacterium]
MRAAGHESIDGIGAVVLETDGSFSVVAGSTERGRAGTLRTVRHGGGGGPIDDADRGE